MYIMVQVKKIRLKNIMSINRYIESTTARVLSFRIGAQTMLSISLKSCTTDTKSLARDTL